jgi:branched-chain amino acid transport system substrate-binding protein
MRGVHGLLEIPSTNEELNNTGQYVVAQTAGAPGASMTDTTLDFIEGYREKYDVYPQGSFAYNCYDAVHLWAEAVEQAGTADSEELVSVLEEISYTGVRGPLEFYGQDHEFTHDLKHGEDNPDLKRVYLQFQDDPETPETVWPEEFASADYQPPSWI